MAVQTMAWECFALVAAQLGRPLAAEHPSAVDPLVQVGRVSVAERRLVVVQRSAGRPLAVQLLEGERPFQVTEHDQEQVHPYRAMVHDPYLLKKKKRMKRENQFFFFCLICLSHNPYLAMVLFLELELELELVVEQLLVVDLRQEVA
jgi:hypothetical protein